MKWDRLAIAAAFAGLAWYLYTRSRGLTLAGEPLNAMMLPSDVRSSQQSLVSPNAGTSLAATNVFGAISTAFQSILGSLKAGAGNTPRIASATSSGIAPGDVTRMGLLVPADEPPPPSLSNISPTWDPSLDLSMPLWQWGTAVPAMPWTLDPVTLGFDPSYIPPPPGS
jgi:hypothetical protein